MMIISGSLTSGDLPTGPTPLVTGAGQRVIITAFPHQVDIIIINIIIPHNIIITLHQADTTIIIIILPHHLS